MNRALLMHRGRPWLRFSWPEGEHPPCLWCGESVVEPSMDGPLVCGRCDAGFGSGDDGKMTSYEHRYRQEHIRRAVAEIRLAQTDEDRAAIQEAGGDPEPATAPPLAIEAAWLERVKEADAETLRWMEALCTES
jgi:hypothetical protein